MAVITAKLKWIDYYDIPIWEYDNAISFPFMKSSESKTLPPGAIEIIAERFKALSEPTRLRLLNALMGGEQSVSELVEATGINQASVSKHLGQLADARMVGRRREGANVIYFISDETIFELCRLMCAKLQKEFGDTAARFS